MGQEEFRDGRPRDGRVPNLAAERRLLERIFFKSDDGPPGQGPPGL